VLSLAAIAMLLPGHLTTEGKPTNNPESWRALDAYEAAFPLADAGFGATLLLAGYGLLRGHAAGPFLLVGAAAISIYLGLLDLTFYAGHGLYAPVNPSVLLELGVNAACIGGGLLGLRAGWRFWRTDAWPAG